MGNDQTNPVNKATAGIASFFHDPVGSTDDAVQSFGTSIDNIFQQPGSNQPGAPAAAKTPAPTLGDANQTIQEQGLKTEQQNYWQRTNLTGAQGLLDTPKTASQTLLGS